MTPSPIIRLQDLPGFHVLQISDADEPELLGVFTHFTGVRAGRSWLYAGESDSLIGDLVDLHEASGRARFWAPCWSPSHPIQVGSIAPWLDGCWQAYHVTMILDPHASWQRRAFTPMPAQYFRQGALYGWRKAGHDLPPDAIPTHVDATGWDHEHCELCQSNIGVGGDAHGYVSRHDRWLCERCYHDYAASHSLGFVFSS